MADHRGNFPMRLMKMMMMHWCSFFSFYVRCTSFSLVSRTIATLHFFCSVSRKSLSNVQRNFPTFPAKACASSLFSHSTVSTTLFSFLAGVFSPFPKKKSSNYWTSTQHTFAARAHTKHNTRPRDGRRRCRGWRRYLEDIFFPLLLTAADIFSLSLFAQKSSRHSIGPLVYRRTPILTQVEAGWLNRSFNSARCVGVSWVRRAICTMVLVIFLFAEKICEM